MSRTARATVTALFGYVKFAIAIVTGLWLVPFTLHHIGARMYGFWIASGVNGSGPPLFARTAANAAASNASEARRGAGWP